MTTLAYPLIIFDWDGTLMDSQFKIVQCLQAACRDVNLPIPAEATLRRIISLGLWQRFTTLYPDKQYHVLADAWIERYRYYSLTDFMSAKPYLGVENMLATLHQQGYLLAIASGKSQQGLTKDITDYQLGHYFSFTRCSDQTFSKPHPQILFDILEFTGLPATQAIMVGDSIYDMECAQHAGVAGIAVTTGIHSALELQAYQPLACLEQVTGLVDWLNLTP